MLFGVFILSIFMHCTVWADDVPSSSVNPPKHICYELPEINVNLSSATDKATYLKVIVVLEIDDGEQEKIKAQYHKIVDQLISLLYEFKLDDLPTKIYSNGIAYNTIIHIKEMILQRINDILKPTLKVRNIFFREFLVW